MSWVIYKASPWGIDLPSIRALKSGTQACGDLVFRVVLVLVKLDTLGGTDTQKAGPHSVVEASTTWRRTAARVNVELIWEISKSTTKKNPGFNEAATIRACVSLSKRV